jgi:hypothetical protein
LLLAKSDGAAVLANRVTRVAEVTEMDTFSGYVLELAGGG